MLNRLSRPVVAGLFLLIVAAGLRAGEQPEIIKTLPAPNGVLPPSGAGAPFGVLPPLGILPPGPMGPPDGPGDHLPPHAIIGHREIGCYHACVEYYSPYHIRPLLEPSIVGQLVRHRLAQLCIPLPQGEQDKGPTPIFSIPGSAPRPVLIGSSTSSGDKEKDKDKDNEKDKDKDKDKKKGIDNDKDKDPVRFNR
jgi:hypothetical protein